MAGRDDHFKQKLMQDHMVQMGMPDEILTWPAFNYSLAFDTQAQSFVLSYDTPKGKRINLPFDRLHFGIFVNAMKDALEKVQNQVDNGTVDQ